MPRLSYLFIRTSLAYLVLGFTFGSLILANKGVPIAPFIWTLLPIHIEFLVLGWLTQLALGVAFWILPRLTSSTPRGDERWSWATFMLINLGIALNIAAPYAGLVCWDCRRGFYKRLESPHLQLATGSGFIPSSFHFQPDSEKHRKQGLISQILFAPAQRQHGEKTIFYIHHERYF